MSEPKTRQDSPTSSQKILLSGTILFLIAACVNPEITLMLSAIFEKCTRGACRLNDDASEHRKWKFLRKMQINHVPKNGRMLHLIIILIIMAL